MRHILHKKACRVCCMSMKLECVRSCTEGRHTYCTSFSPAGSERAKVLDEVVKPRPQDEGPHKETQRNQQKRSKGHHESLRSTECAALVGNEAGRGCLGEVGAERGGLSGRGIFLSTALDRTSVAPLGSSLLGESDLGSVRFRIAGDKDRAL